MFEEMEVYMTERDSLKEKVAELTNTLDLMSDEFERIRALNFDSEINALCERAVSQIRQAVPVIQQRDHFKSLADSREKYEKWVLENGPKVLRLFQASSYLPSSIDELSELLSKKEKG